MIFGIPRLHNAERIAITGMGVVSPIGHGVSAFWSSLIGGVSGISAIERFDTADMRVGRGGEIKRLPEPPEGSPLPPCRASQFLIHAALEAMQQAGLEPASGLGVVVGAALGGIGEAERFQAEPRDLRALDGAAYDGPTRRLARWLGADGPVLSLSTACASGATSLGIGADLLQAGAATAVLAGGVDILCRFVMQGFNRMRSLTRDEVRPFDRRRSGLLLGEGAGVIVLERESAARQRGAEPIGWLRGHASCADGSHITAPDDEGGGLERAVRLAMRQAGVGPEAIEFISAHGTGTPSNDRVETRVFKRVLGPHAYAAPINSIKAHMGHTMGAAAILETIMCLLCWRHGQIPPTLNYCDPDPVCDLDYTPGMARSRRPRISLKTAAGFAGCNACLVLEGA
jgi:3-oxoacyl-(acyl-carrier-protein) synthase